MYGSVKTSKRWFQARNSPEATPASGFGTTPTSGLGTHKCKHVYKTARQCKTHVHEAATRYSYSVLVGKCQFLALLHHSIQSCSINGSFILRGWSCTNVLTSSLMFSSDNSLLQRSLLIFIKANPLNLDWLMVARLAVLISFN